MTLRELLPDLGRRTLVMGILNVTPDSFSDGARYIEPEAALSQARKMVDEGADLIDIGGESTRPGAHPVPAQEEMRRVLPVIERVHAALPSVPISLDTMKAPVARAGVAAGAALVNDVSAGTGDASLLTAVSDLGVPFCLMHLPVRPEAMGWSRAGGGLDADADAVQHAIDFLRDRVAAALAAGVGHENLLIDPGFGFGKTPTQNLSVLRRIGEIKAALHDLPVLIGPSRKSTIVHVLGPAADREDPDRMAGTAALVALAVAAGADIVRVHDVGFMRRVVQVADAAVRA